MPTVLEVLRAANPVVDPSALKPGNNTAPGPEWKHAESWRPWSDFKFSKLCNIFRDELSTTFRGQPTSGPVLYRDGELRDEKTLDFFLHRFVLPDVNLALNACNTKLFICPGSWVGYADWGLVGDVSPQYELNLLPGDTKLSSKWYPDLKVDDKYEWQLPISQVQTYAVDSRCRYGYIITDEFFVALRFSPERVGAGRASQRPRRPDLNPTHQRVASDGTDLSSSMAGMSIDSAHSIYVDSPNALEYPCPEYAVVPWEQDGGGRSSRRGSARLSVKLALFFLCLMAGRGDAHMQSDYPPLDSWRQIADGSFRHVTSGRSRRRLPTGAVLVEAEIPGLPEADDGEYQMGDNEGNNDEEDEEQEDADEEENEDDEDTEEEEQVDDAEGIVSTMLMEGLDYEEASEHLAGPSTAALDWRTPQGPAHPDSTEQFPEKEVAIWHEDGKIWFRHRGVKEKSKLKNWRQVNGRFEMRSERFGITFFSPKWV